MTTKPEEVRELIEQAREYLVKDVDHLHRPDAMNLAWLAAQLAAWPTRVDERFTTNDRFLRMSAAQFIVDQHEAATTLDQLLRENERLRGAISWLERPFITDETSVDELRARIRFMLTDVARATLNQKDTSHE